MVFSLTSYSQKINVFSLFCITFSFLVFQRQLGLHFSQFSFCQTSLSIHLEVASDSFCFLINSSWLLVFILYVFFIILSGFNLNCWKGIHFSQNNFLIFLLLFLGLIFCFHFWFRDLLREFDKKYEVLLIIFFLVFLLFLVSEGLLFVSFFWTSFHSLSSPTLGLILPGEGFYLPDPCELTLEILEKEVVFCNRFQHSQRLHFWFSGIILFFFLMATAFMGYVLPFGQMSFWNLGFYVV